MKKPKHRVEIYTDGACRGNPGIGGWGAVLKYHDHKKTIFGSQSRTTNNQMELTAAIRALAALKYPCHVKLVTDSQYVKKGITLWLANWKRRHWKTTNKRPVKNAELWKQLESEVARHDIEWEWIKGHTGHAENELADELANFAIDELLEKEAKK
jgi:ribonuclease HI